MKRSLAIIAVLASILGCAPTHNVKPLPDFVNVAIQPGDKVTVTTKFGETTEFVVSEVTREALIGEDYRVALEDIDALSKTAWKRPASPCGGEKALGCSVPLPVSLSSKVYNHYSDHFYDACAQHDYCYRHGFRTYGLDRDTCDAEFLQDMRMACPAPSPTGFGKIMDVMSHESRDTCLSTADEFYVVVRKFGEEKFQTDTSTVCEYNGPAEALK